MIRSAACLVSTTLILSACTSAGTYPSLARRDVERVSGSAQGVTPEPAPAPDFALPSPGMAGRLGQIVAKARGAHQQFSARRGEAERAVAAASGAALASESWSVATAALAVLESARSEAMIALADLDQLHVADRMAHTSTPSGDGAEIDKARDAVTTLIGQEDRELAALHGRLRN